MILERGVDAHVDILDEELDGLQAFGSLMVVPGGQSLITSFHFQLPRSVITTRNGQSIYHLHVDKQPGTLAIPVTLRVHLPPHAILQSSSMQAITQDNDLLIETNLQTDVDLKIMFAAP
jgi:hypothetical protein